MALARKSSGLDAETRRWMWAGRDGDIPTWALHGLGIALHPAQVEVCQKFVEGGEVRYYDLHWGNRAGKSTLLLVLHGFSIYHKWGLWTEDEDDWLHTDYRSLHCAPIGRLATRVYQAWTEVTKGTSVAQRDEYGKRRPAPLAATFVCTTERVANSGDIPIVRCLNGFGTTDFYSTEGGAARLEGTSWRLITWDEWPQMESADKGEEYERVFNRLQNRAADTDAPIILTGTPTPETEHIGKDMTMKAESAEYPDWWGNSASRMLNPSANLAAIERYRRTAAPEDIARAIDGGYGGVKGRVFPEKMLAPVFIELPRRQGPVRVLGADGRSPFVYLHAWDIALSDAENVGLTFRVPRSWKFSVADPLLGVALEVIPGSRTLTPDEIRLSIESAFRLYGEDGVIVLDTTEGNGMGIYRELRLAGLPVVSFTFNERDTRGVIKKDAALRLAHRLLTEGMVERRDKLGALVLDTDRVPTLESPPDGQYGVVRMPRAWLKVHDQLAVLRADDRKQKKDAAMAFLMACYVAERRRKAARAAPTGHFAMFAGGRT
jgi:hypothetical protein